MLQPHPSGLDAGSDTITMRLSPAREEGEQSSPVHIINGLPWRLVVARQADPIWHTATLHCDAAAEYEMWRAAVVLRMSAVLPVFQDKDARKEYAQQSHAFASWLREGSKCEMVPCRIGPNSTEISVEITVQKEAMSFTRRPKIDLRSSIHDVILVVGGQKFPVNKKVLSEHSQYFTGIFYSGFKESTEKEIELHETNPEDFHEVLKMFYGMPSEPIAAENVARYLMMADMFDLKASGSLVVKDRVESFLLSTPRVSDQDKMVLANQYRLEILKKSVLPLFTNRWHIL